MRKMKDSGIPWIGEIPEEWNIIKLKYLFSIIGGNGFPDALQGNAEGDYPFCKVSDINGSSDYVNTASNWVSEDVAEQYKFSIIPVGSIIMAKIGAALAKNHRKINTVACCIDNNTQALVLKRRDCLRYLLYLSKCIDMRWFDNNSTVPSINNSKLLSFFVPDVPKEEQQRIADYLDAECARIDAVMEQTRASIEEYKKLKQSIITEAVTKGIRPNRPMKDSGIDWIGQIPAEWDCSILKRYCKFQTGTTPSTANPEWFDGTVNWFTPSDFSDNYALVESTRTLSEKARNDGVVTLVPPNTVLIVGIGATAGKIGYVEKECSCNQQITALLGNESLIAKFLMYWMVANTKHLRETALFTTLPIINNQTIGNYPLIVPKDIDEQVEIIKFLDSKTNEISRLIKEKMDFISELESYKKSLIFEYVTGKKEVK